MLDRLLRTALRQRPLVLALAGALLLLGAGAWAALKLEAYPDVSDTEVAVITTYPGRAAEEVEQQVTIPIERALNGVPRVAHKRSRTIFGLSIVRLTFEEGTDDWFARQRVLEKLADADLPDGVQPTLGPLSTPVGEILRYVVEGDPSHSPMELRELQDWVITPKLLGAPGIADVTNFGGLVRQFNVVVNPALLDKFGLTITDVADKITANNASTGGNVIARGASQLAVRAVGRLTTAADVGRIVLATRNGTPVFVRDVARVETGALPPSGILGYTEKGQQVDEDNGVEGIVLMRRGENPSEVITGVKAKIDTLNAGLLPKGVTVRIAYDRSELVASTLETVGHTLLEGVTIVLVVLLVFLGSIRAALACALTIPLSLAFAFIAMKLTGIPANLLSLGAIDFGIIVDAAVVMVEAIARQIGHATPAARAHGTRRLVFQAAQGVQRQILFAVCIIILAYLPLFTLQRVEGKLFSPMAYTLAYAIGGSLLLSLTVVPVLCSYLLGPDWTEWHNPVLGWLEARYAGTLRGFVRRPLPVLGAGALLVLAAIAVGARLGTEFLPELDEGGFNIRTILPAGVSLQEARQYPALIRAAITRHPEVRVAISQLGRNDDGTDPYGPSRIETLVQLQPYRTWPAGETKADLLVTLQHDLEQAVPGAGFSFSQPILDNVSEAVTGSAADLAVLVKGPDQTVLRATANQILAQVATVPGASESGLEQEGPQSQLSIEPDREALARYGLNVKDLNDVIELAVAGRPVSTVYEGERRFDVALRYPLDARASADAIRNILVPTPSGARIPLGQLADVREVSGQTIIFRDDGARQVGVRTNVRDRDQGSFVADAQKLVAAHVKVPEGYSVKWGGQFENLTRAKRRLGLVIPVTVLLIYVVLVLLFRGSLRDAGIVLTNVPFALVGGIAALWVRGYPFNVSAGVGFVSLFGVAVMSGVLLVSHIRALREAGHLGLRRAVVQGAVTQLRPILMMMCVALIGLLPAARGTGIGSDIQRPLATVIVGGLLSALVLTLLVMPPLYCWIEARALRRTRARRTQARRTGGAEGDEETF